LLNLKAHKIRVIFVDAFGKLVTMSLQPCLCVHVSGSAGVLVGHPLDTIKVGYA